MTIEYKGARNADIAKIDKDDFWALIAQSESAVWAGYGRR